MEAHHQGLLASSGTGTSAATKVVVPSASSPADSSTSSSPSATCKRTESHYASTTSRGGRPALQVIDHQRPVGELQFGDIGLSARKAPCVARWATVVRSTAYQ